MQIADTLNNLFETALVAAQNNNQLNLPDDFNFDACLERPKDDSHGDFACTLAMRLAKIVGKNPREIAQIIIDNIPQNSEIKNIEIAGPGFINIYLNFESVSKIIEVILDKKFDFAKNCAKDIAKDIDKNVNLEYISANPTGPMHVGHGRWAALGDSIAKIMRHAGYEVYEEFYLNDHGVQMNLFANSIVVRYLQALGVDAEMPDDAYGGEYVKDIAENIINVDGNKWLDANEEARLEAFKKIGQDHMIAQLTNTLDKFGTKFDLYFSESSLYDGKVNKVDKVLQEFKSNNLIYEKDGATWFKSSQFGDDKDRVIIKENGEFTYFLSDCAYHYDKLQRGFNHLIDI